jgi:ATPase subunit of ABC transporter with duplicated ATPase domains
VSAVDGLISLLKESLASCLIISHDKEFLDEVVTKVFEIDE